MGGPVQRDTMKPFCFVLMPFGTKKDDVGRVIEFDAIYSQIISPAVNDADMEPIRADEESVGGIIHKPLFERLLLCDYAVADLTTANPNVLYELGIRHGIRPHSTVLMFARGMRLPFDVTTLRGLRYNLDESGRPAAAVTDRRALAEQLNSCRDPVEDSPLFQLVTDWPRPDIAHLKTDRFRDLVAYSKQYKEKLARARQSGPDAVVAVERELNIVDTDPAVIVDLFLSYRAVKAWQAMVDLVSKMSPVLARTVLVREQLGFALNRLKQSVAAEQVLEEVIQEHGSSSETNGLLGRVYKDRWEEACNANKEIQAQGYLKRAIDTYVAGFEADWRDPYPGVNAVTLMEFDDPVDARQGDLLPVVQFSSRRRLVSTRTDYWDHATALELAVLTRDTDGAQRLLADSLAAVREHWEPESTSRNLRLIREARTRRGEDAAWIETLEKELSRAAVQCSLREP